MYTGCTYPTYYDSISDQCVTTCPEGTIGNVSRSNNATARNCTSREFIILLISYIVTYLYACMYTYYVRNLKICKQYNILVIFLYHNTGPKQCLACLAHFAHLKLALDMNLQVHLTQGFKFAVI